jgi:hypothetical protein
MFRSIFVVAWLCLLSVVQSNMISSNSSVERSMVLFPKPLTQRDMIMQLPVQQIIIISKAIDGHEPAPWNEIWQTGELLRALEFEMNFLKFRSETQHAQELILYDDFESFIRPFQILNYDFSRSRDIFRKKLADSESRLFRLVSQLSQIENQRDLLKMQLQAVARSLKSLWQLPVHVTDMRTNLSSTTAPSKSS